MRLINRTIIIFKLGLDFLQRASFLSGNQRKIASFIRTDCWVKELLSSGRLVVVVAVAVPACCIHLSTFPALSIITGSKYLEPPYLAYLTTSN